MLFNSTLYLVFLLAVVLLYYHLLQRGRRIMQLHIIHLTPHSSRRRGTTQ